MTGPNTDTATAPPESRLNGRLFLIAFLAAAALLLIGILLDQDPKNDVASCYARQVREFAGGNWDTAFFHMTPPLTVVLGGILAKLGLPAFTALKLVSAAFFLAGLWPLRRLLRRMVPGPLAEWGCLLYALAPQLTRYAASGLLDMAKMFFLLWLAELLTAQAVDTGSKWRRSLWIGAAFAGLALARAEGLFFLPLVLACMFIPDLVRKPACTCGRLKPALLGAARAGLAAGVALILCLPQALYERGTTGYPVLDSRQIAPVRKVLEKLSLGGRWDAMARPVQTPPGQPVIGTAKQEDRPEDTVTPWRNLKETAKGLEPLFLALAGLGLWLRLRRREFGLPDAVCAAFILYNVLLLTGTGFILKRYVMTTQPFLLVWAVTGVLCVKERFLDRMHVRLFPAAAILVLVVSAGAVAPKLVHLNPPEKPFGCWLRAHRGGFITPATQPLKSDLLDYHDGRLPLVLAAVPQYSFWAECDWVIIPGKYSCTPDELRQIARRQNAGILVVDKQLYSLCPELKPEQTPWLEAIKDAPANPRIAAYRIIRPEQEPPP